ncbi:MAG: PadR family transcriptional regulator [Nocardioidaceae bacterium]
MRRPSNPLALAVLTLLYEKPMHPYEMSSTLRERRKEDSIRVNYGSLYSVVESLAKKGLIEAKETVRHGRRPERTIYQLTDAGEVTMTDWLSEILSIPTPQFTDFEAALSLIAVLPVDDARDLLSRRLKELQFQRTTYDAVRNAAPTAFPRLFMIEGEYQAALRDAETEFVRKLIADIDNDDLSGLTMWRRMHELRDEDRSPEDIQKTIAAEFAEELTWQTEPD